MDLVSFRGTTGLSLLVTFVFSFCDCCFALLFAVALSMTSEFFSVSFEFLFVWLPSELFLVLLFCRGLSLLFFTSSIFFHAVEVVKVGVWSMH